MNQGILATTEIDVIKEIETKKVATMKEEAEMSTDIVLSLPIVTVIHLVGLAVPIDRAVVPKLVRAVDLGMSVSDIAVHRQLEVN